MWNDRLSLQPYMRLLILLPMKLCRWKLKIVGWKNEGGILMMLGLANFEADDWMNCNSHRITRRTQWMEGSHQSERKSRKYQKQTLVMRHRITSWIKHFSTHFYKFPPDKGSRCLDPLVCSISWGKPLLLFSPLGDLFQKIPSEIFLQYLKTGIRIQYKWIS